MNLIVKSWKNKRDFIWKYKEKVFSCIITTLFFWSVYRIMLVQHFSADSYRYYANPLLNNKGNLALGRIGDFIVNEIICRLGLNYVRNQFIFVIILILTVSISVELIYNHYIKICNGQINWNKKLVLKSAIILMFCNVFILEWFIYTEMAFLWSLSLIFMDLAVIQITPQCNVKHMIRSIVYVFVSVSFYQASISYFVIFALIGIYIGYAGKLNKSSFTDSIKVFICGGLGGIFNLAFIKLMQILNIVQSTNRTESLSLDLWINNIETIFQNIKRWLLDSYGLLPKYSLIVIVLIMYTLLVVGLIKKKKKLNLIYIILLIIMCNIMVYIPHFLTSTVWMAQRTITSFFVFLIIPYIILNVQNVGQKIQKLSIVTFLIFLIINIRQIEEISVDVIASNKIDEEISYLIQDEIQKYEMQNNTKIKNISLVNDINPHWGYNAIEYVCFDTNLRSYVVNWGGVDCINYYNKTEYNSVEMNENIYETHFSGKNWDFLDLDEQMVFQGDTLYMVSY